MYRNAPFSGQSEPHGATACPHGSQSDPSGASTAKRLDIRWKRAKDVPSKPPFAAPCMGLCLPPGNVGTGYHPMLSFTDMARTNCWQARLGPLLIQYGRRYLSARESPQSLLFNPCPGCEVGSRTNSWQTGAVGSGTLPLFPSLRSRGILRDPPPTMAAAASAGNAVLPSPFLSETLCNR